MWSAPKTEISKVFENQRRSSSHLASIAIPLPRLHQPTMYCDGCSFTDTHVSTAYAQQIIIKQHHRCMCCFSPNINYIVMLLISSLKWVRIHTTSTPEPWGLYLNQSKSSSRSDFCDQRLPFTTLKIAGGEDYHRFSLSLICRIRVSLQPARRPIFS